MNNKRIYLISPSGVVADAEALSRAQARLDSFGYPTRIDPDALAQHQRFAGPDAVRLAAINRALQPDVGDIVMATRGGYGLSRLLAQIDWTAVADSGKRFIGYSDFTAFNLALLAQTGAISYSGPCALGDFGGQAAPDDLTVALFDDVMQNRLEILSFEAPEADAFDGRGILWGGNLAMLASLVGTPYLPDVSQGLLFLEDVGEPPYRVERMLTQLWHAGILQQQQAILLGAFSDYRLGNLDRGYDMPAVIQWLRRTVEIPVIPGLPYGHVSTKATLPIGQRVGCATEKGMAYLVLHVH